MRQFWLLLFIAPFLFLSCSEDNQTPESPADADDNFITSVVMTVASQSYTAEIHILGNNYSRSGKHY